MAKKTQTVTNELRGMEIKEVRKVENVKEAQPVKSVAKVAEPFSPEQMQIIQQIVADAKASVAQQPITAIIQDGAMPKNHQVEITSLVEGVMSLTTGGSNPYPFSISDMFRTVTVPFHQANDIVMKMRDWFEAGSLYVVDNTEDQRILKGLMLDKIQSDVLSADEMIKFTESGANIQALKKLMFSEGKLVKGTFRQVKNILVRYTNKAKRGEISIDINYLRGLVSLLNKMRKECHKLNKTVAEANRTYNTDMFYQISAYDESDDDY